jgi:hypothetical protein
VVPPTFDPLPAMTPVAPEPAVLPPVPGLPPQLNPGMQSLLPPPLAFVPPLPAAMPLPDEPPDIAFGSVVIGFVDVQLQMLAAAPNTNTETSALRFIQAIFVLPSTVFAGPSSRRRDANAPDAVEASDHPGYSRMLGLVVPSAVCKASDYPGIRASIEAEVF